MNKSVAIVQSNYIPWKGYFDLINLVDEFIIYDEVQFTRRDWRNRNKIKTPNGTNWVTIPVETKGKYLQKINEVKVQNQKWVDDHLKAIELNYKNARYYDEISQLFYETYDECRKEILLSNINYNFIKKICDLLEINTKLRLSTEYILYDDRSERLLNMCLQAGANIYLSGPAAKNYLDTDLFLKNGIKVEWMDYTGYKPYEQMFSSSFIHEVSIIDLLFNMGPKNAKQYMVSF